MDTQKAEFVRLVESLPVEDVYFLKLWAEMVRPAERRWVTRRRTGTGPLVLVGKPQPAPEAA